LLAIIGGNDEAVSLDSADLVNKNFAQMVDKR